MYEKICRKYIDYLIRKWSKKHRREKHFVNLQNISKIILLFSADKVSVKRMEEIKRLLDDKKQTMSWVFVPQETFLANKVDVNLLTKKEISILQKPSAKTVRSFLANEYDVLIDLTTKEILPLKYLLGISNVPCRCGLKKEGYSSYDLEIEASGKIKNTELLKQILHYLSTIKTK
jgi:hypothetical protein